MRVVFGEGEATARGRTLGRELGDEIARSLAFYRGLVDGVRLETVAEPYRRAAERVLPEHLAMLEGMAAGAEADFWELFAVNAWEELEPRPAAVPADRCTTLVVSGPGYTLLGHNEQWLAGDAGSVALVVDAPVGGPTVVSPTIAACLPAVGVNEYGTAQGIDSLTARDDGVGVPRVLVSRHSLAAAHPDDARLRATVPGRAGGYGHVFAFPGGAAMRIETTARDSAVLDGPGGHTNHYLDERLATVGDEPSDGSCGRYERLEQLLAARDEWTPDDVMDVLRDHDSRPQAICKHADDRDPESSATLFSLVCDVDGGRMWVAPGPPCETAYEEIELADVV
ncbi:MAG: C45 family peptidase [Actinomycetota bacterium]|nr:C45 family peptidase [Actinomycetota bacterium]